MNTKGLTLPPSLTPAADSVFRISYPYITCGSCNPSLPSAIKVAGMTKSAKKEEESGGDGRK